MSDHTDEAAPVPDPTLVHPTPDFPGAQAESGSETLPPAVAETVLESDPVLAEDPTLVHPVGPEGSSVPEAWGPALANDPEPHWTLRIPLACAAEGAESPTLPESTPGAEQDSLVPHEAVRLRVAGLEGSPAETEADADYVVKELLGSGGMGNVYLADQPALGREVALKLIRPHLAKREGIERRFVEESVFTGRLEHPSIVTVHQLGRTRDARLVLSMRRVRGESLRELLAREPATTPERLRRYLEILGKVADAISYSHSEGVLHRDLKPANVMVGAFGEVQVMDWGLAMRWEEVRGAQGPAGTPAYMPPEQANDEVERFGPTLDVFGLGALLYEVLTATPPYLGGSTFEVLGRACMGLLVDPRERAPERELPADLVEHCLAALRADPAERLPSAAAFKQGLEQHLVHSAALRLIERARRLLEPPQEGAEPLTVRAQRLERAEALLTQALEVWPESKEALELAQATRLERADLALDRADPAKALALVADAEGEVASELRAAAARQVTRRRNQALVAIVLGFLFVGGWAAWKWRLSDVQERARDRLAARAELPTRVDGAWKRLSEEDDSATALHDTFQTAYRAGWARPPRYPWLSLANVWQSVRAGNRGLALDQLTLALPKELRQTFRERRAEAVGGRSIFEVADKWAEQAREAQAPPAMRAAGEAILLLIGVVPREEAELARLRARVWELGAVAPLLDPRAGARPPWLDADLPTLRVHRAPHSVYLQALDPLTGRERWRFPPGERLQAVRTDGLTVPLVVRGSQGPLVVVAMVTEILFLDPATGQVRQRLRAHSWINALLPVGTSGEFLAVQRPQLSWGDGRSRAVRASMERGWLATPGTGSATALTFPFTELLGRLDNAVQAVAPSGAPGTTPELHRREFPLTTQLKIVAAVRAADSTLPLLPLLEARVFWLAGQRPSARLAVADLLRQDLSPWELAWSALVLARLSQALEAAPDAPLMTRPGRDPWGLALPFMDRRAARLRSPSELWLEIDRVIGAAVRVAGERENNPSAAPGVKWNAGTIIRLVSVLALHTRGAATLERHLRQAHALSTHQEADVVFLARERAKLDEAGRDTSWIDAFEEDVHLYGAHLLPHELFRVADLCAVVVGTVPILLILIVLTLIARTHAARSVDLRALGFRSRGQEWLGFLANPFLRGSHTFLAYSTRGQRALLLVGSLLVLASFLYVTAVVSAVRSSARLPHELTQGELSHPAAQSYLRAALSEARAPRACLRLLAEGSWQGRDSEGVERRLIQLERGFPGDAYAAHQQAILSERKGDLQAARAGYRSAADCDEAQLSAAGRYNLARLEGQALPELPPAYAVAIGRPGPLSARVPGRDLRAALGLPNAVVPLLVAHFQEALAGRADWLDPAAHQEIAGFYFSELHRGSYLVRVEGYLAAGAILPLLLLALLAEVHLPFGTRGRGQGPSAKAARWLEGLGQVGNLVWPGMLWISRGQVGRGMLTALSVSALFVLGQVSRKGSTLVRLGLDNFTTLGGRSFDATELISPELRIVGAVAWLVLGIVFVVAWTHGFLLLKAWRRGRGATAAPDPHSLK